MWVFGIAAIVVLALGLGSSSKRSRPGPRSIDPPVEPAAPTASDLALEVPLEALRRYGTTADAASLTDQGVDLAALGYTRPAEDGR